MLTVKKRCYGCMKEKQQSPVCEHCGYNENVPNYSHQLPIGTVLKGQYLVGKVLGQGGFGITYMGWDMLLENPVAIKEYYPNSFVNRDCNQTLDVVCAGDGAKELFAHNRDRFLREAKILAKLQNVPGIVRVQNLCEENNTAYIIMEYVEGIDLKHYIRLHNRVLTSEETLAVMRPILYALHKVHEAELVHRDISPDNIMILPDGTAKLLDFGAAREVTDAEVDKELPQSTEAILKHGFAPMEQYRRRGTLGPWTDVYALCATMYYCMTGKVANSAPERMLGDDNINWKQIPGLRPQQIEVLEKGMALVPENRIRTIRELHNGLFGQNATGFTQVKKEEPKPEPVKKQEKKAEKKPDYPTHTVSLESEEPTPVVTETKEKKKSPIGLIAAALAIIAAVGVFALKPKEDGDIVPTDKPVLSATEPAIAVTLSEEEKQYLAAEELEAAGEYGKAAIAFGKLGDYADSRTRSYAMWAKVPNRETISYWGYSLSAIGKDGTLAVSAWVDGMYTNVNLRETYYDLVSVSDWVCLKNDGTVLCLPSEVNYFVFEDMKEMYSNLTKQVSRWTDIIAVSCSGYCVLGLKTDGTVVAVGDDREGNLEVENWTDIVAIVAGGTHSLGLKSDGTVVATGRNEKHQCDVSDWTDIVDIAISNSSTMDNMSVGLKADGSVVAVGSDYGAILADIRNWKDVVELSSDICGIKADGTGVIAIPQVYFNGGWKNTSKNITQWTDLVHLITNRSDTVGLKSDGTLLFTRENKVAENWKVLLPDEIPEPHTPVDAEKTEPTEEFVLSSPYILSKDWFEKLPATVSKEMISSITIVDTDGPADAWDVSEAGNGRVRAWLSGNGEKKALYIGADGGVDAPADCEYLFAWFPYVESIHFGDAFRTAGVTSMGNMFQGCSSLKELDLSGFDTSRVTDMAAMFCTCSKLTSLDLSSFDTSNVTTMAWMFCECTSPLELDLSSWDVSNVGNMYQMFFKFSWVGSVDISGWDVSNVNNYELFMDGGRTINGQPWERLFEQ